MTQLIRMARYYPSQKIISFFSLTKTSQKWHYWWTK